jgi:hypothetical protein
MNGFHPRVGDEGSAVSGTGAAQTATLAPVSQRSLQSRVVAAAEEALARQGFVTPVDVCLGLGWLQDCNVDDWRHGRADDLEEFLPVHDNRLIDLHVYLHHWVTGQRGKRLAQRDEIRGHRAACGCRTCRPGRPVPASPIPCLGPSARTRPAAGSRPARRPVRRPARDRTLPVLPASGTRLSKLAVSRPENEQRVLRPRAKIEASGDKFSICPHLYVPPWRYSQVCGPLILRRIRAFHPAAIRFN